MPSVRIRLLCLFAFSIFASAPHFGCGAGAFGGASSSDSAPPLVEVEAVGDALRTEVDWLLEEGAQDALQELSTDLTPGVQLLALLRSPRAAALAHELNRLPEARPIDDDGWGGRRLLRWTYALQQWELRGVPDHTALQDLHCVAPPSRGEAAATEATLPPWQGAARTKQQDERTVELDAAAAKDTPPRSNSGDEDEDDDETSGDGDYDPSEDPEENPGSVVPARSWAAFEREHAADVHAYGVCILERLNAAFEGADRALTPILRASFGELHKTANAWLRGRALPVDDGALLGADDVGLRSARAWTELPSVDEPYHTTGLIIALRTTGVQVAFRPAVSGERVLSNSAAPHCGWPGRQVLQFANIGQTVPQSALREGLEALTKEVERCEQQAGAGRQAGTRALVDAGLRWEAIAPVLRTMVSLRRAPTLLVHEAQSGLLSALPTELMHDVPGGACGVEAHLRRDGVVLRGGGSPVRLLSWAEADAFAQLTAASKEAVERCETLPLVRVFIDDPTVDWGLIVRVIERMSWPQACEDGPCLRSVLVVGGV